MCLPSQRTPQCYKPCNSTDTCTLNESAACAGTLLCTNKAHCYFSLVFWRGVQCCAEEISQYGSQSVRVSLIFVDGQLTWRQDRPLQILIFQYLQWSILGHTCDVEFDATEWLGFQHQCLSLEPEHVEMSAFSSIMLPLCCQKKKKKKKKI